MEILCLALFLTTVLAYLGLKMCFCQISGVDFWPFNGLPRVTGVSNSRNWGDFIGDLKTRSLERVSF